MARYAALAMRAQSPEPEPVTEVNIIPVIDISLVLLVILFVTAPLLSQPALPVDLPRARAPAGEEPSLALTLTPEGRLFVRAEASSWESAAEDLARELARRPEAAVLVRADRGTPYREVQRLIALAQSAGARSVALAADPR